MSCGHDRSGHTSSPEHACTGRTRPPSGSRPSAQVRVRSCVGRHPHSVITHTVARPAPRHTTDAAFGSTDAGRASRTTSATGEPQRPCSGPLPCAAGHRVAVDVLAPQIGEDHTLVRRPLLTRLGRLTCAVDAASVSARTDDVVSRPGHDRRRRGSMAEVVRFRCTCDARPREQDGGRGAHQSGVDVSPSRAGRDAHGVRPTVC